MSGDHPSWKLRNMITENCLHYSNQAMYVVVPYPADQGQHLLLGVHQQLQHNLFGKQLEALSSHPMEIKKGE